MYTFGEKKKNKKSKQCWSRLVNFHTEKTARTLHWTRTEIRNRKRRGEKLILLYHYQSVYDCLVHESFRLTFQYHLKILSLSSACIYCKIWFQTLFETFAHWRIISYGGCEHTQVTNPFRTLGATELARFTHIWTSDRFWSFEETNHIERQISLKIFVSRVFL